jgi:hypothetical protein
MVLRMQLESMNMLCGQNTHIFLKIFENLVDIMYIRCTQDNA